LIKEHEIYTVLGNEIPSLCKELQKIDDVKSPYKVMSHFAKFTLAEIEKNNLKTIKKCVLLAEKILEDGDQNIRKAFSVIYIQPLAHPLLNYPGALKLPVRLRSELKKVSAKILKKNKAE
jgi:hypothetical protein